MQNNTIARWGVLIAIVIAIVAGVHWFGSSSAPATVDSGYGATIVGTRFPDGLSVGSTSPVRFKMLVGNSGDSILRENFGFCNIQAAANTIAASSTINADCVTVAGTPPGTALNGVSVNDKVFLSQASTSPATFEGLRILGASASSTAGFITLALYNGTGNTFTWTAAASSSWPYWVLR